MTTVSNCNATGKHVASYKSFTYCLLLYIIIHNCLRYDRNSIIITFIVVVIMQIIIYGTQLQYITVIATIIVKKVLNSNRTHLCYSQIHKDRYTHGQYRYLLCPTQHTHTHTPHMSKQRGAELI